MDLAQRVLAEAKLAGIVGDDHCPRQQAMRLDGAPERALGGDPHRLGEHGQPVEAEYRQVRRLGGLVGKAPYRTRHQLLDRVTSELRVHEKIEEEILYPALKKHPKARDIVLEGYQEHHVADLLVEELHAMDVSDERWGAKFKVLQEGIEHHIEEEEGDMFPKAVEIFSPDELNEIGDQMQALRMQALGTE